MPLSYVKSKNLRKTKDRRFEPVFIHQDLTPLQRERRRQLVQELRQRKEGGETDLIIVKGKIVTRRTWQDAEY